MEKFKVNIFRHVKIRAKDSKEAISKALKIKLKAGEKIYGHDHTDSTSDVSNPLPLDVIRKRGVWTKRMKTYSVTITKDVILSAVNIEAAIVKTKKIKLERGARMLVIGEDIGKGMALLRPHRKSHSRLNFGRLKK